MTTATLEPTAEAWVTVDEAAALLDCPGNTVYRRLKSGALASRKAGRLLVSRASVDAYLAHQAGLLAEREAIAREDAKLAASRVDCLGVHEAARILKMCTVSVIALLQQGTLPHTKDAFRYYIPRAPVEALAKSRSAEGLAPIAEAAAFLGLTIRHLRGCADRGVLPAAWISNERHFAWTDLHDLKAALEDERMLKPAILAPLTADTAPNPERAAERRRGGDYRKLPPERARKQAGAVTVHIGTVNERLEGVCEALDLDPETWAKLLRGVLPELYDEPPKQRAARTDALPGTPEKLQCLESRADAGQPLFHAADARWEDDDRAEKRLVSDECNPRSLHVKNFTVVRRPPGTTDGLPWALHADFYSNALPREPRRLSLTLAC